MKKPPFWRVKRQSGFTTLPPALLLKQPVVVLLLERALVTRLLAKEEHIGNEDLRGSGRCSVIPYVHGKMEVVLQCALQSFAWT
jgi:hypothetical protein